MQESTLLSSKKAAEFSTLGSRQANESIHVLMRVPPFLEGYPPPSPALPLYIFRTANEKRTKRSVFWNYYFAVLFLFEHFRHKKEKKVGKEIRISQKTNGELPTHSRDDP